MIINHIGVVLLILSNSYIMNNIKMLNHDVQIYALCGILGFLVGFIVLYLICKYQKRSFEDVVYIYVWSVITALIGAKILYIFTSIPAIISDYRINNNLINIIQNLIIGGFVYYGGLIGGIAGVFIFSKYFKKNYKEILSYLAPVLALIHSFGRIGCFLVGCCYGVETHFRFFVVYHDSKFAPNGKKLFPIQFLEAATEFIAFILLIILLYRCKKVFLKSGGIFYSYLIYYSTVRFIFEFFRGDEIRGKCMFFTTSQWISVLLFAIGIIFLIFSIQKSKNLNTNEKDNF